MTPQSVTFDLDPELVTKIDRSAEAEQTGRSAILNRALELYFDQEEYELASIRESMRQAEAGMLIPLEDVLADMKKWDEED